MFICNECNQIVPIKKVRVKCGSTYRCIGFTIVLIEIQRESFYSVSSKIYQMNHFGPTTCSLELESCVTPEDCVNCEILKELQIEVENIQYWTNYGDAFRSRALLASKWPFDIPRKMCMDLSKGAIID